MSLQAKNICATIYSKDNTFIRRRFVWKSSFLDMKCPNIRLSALTARALRFKRYISKPTRASLSALTPTNDRKIKKSLLTALCKHLIKIKTKIPLANQTVDKGFCLSFVFALLTLLIFLILIVLLIFLIILLIILVLVILIFFVFVVLISIHHFHPLFVISNIVLPLFICIYILILKSIFPKQKGSAHGRAPLLIIEFYSCLSFVIM